MLTSDNLLRAADIAEQRGMCVGRLESVDYSVCALGAIGLATGTRLSYRSVEGLPETSYLKRATGSSDLEDIMLYSDLQVIRSRESLVVDALRKAAYLAKVDEAQATEQPDLSAQCEREVVAV